MPIKYIKLDSTKSQIISDYTDDFYFDCKHNCIFVEESIYQNIKQKELNIEIQLISNPIYNRLFKSV